MALDNANYIAELSPADPPGTDPINQGDDQIRTTKRAVQQSFPAFVGTTASPASVSKTEAQINDLAEKSATQTISAQWTFNASPRLANNTPLIALNNAGTGTVNLVNLNGSDNIVLGTSTHSENIHACASQHRFYIGQTITANESARVDTRNNGSVLVADRDGNFKKAAFRNGELEAETSDYTAVQADEGRHKYLAAGCNTLTLPQLEGFTEFIIANIDSSSKTIAGSGVTLRWLNGSGGFVTGNRTIAGGGAVGVKYNSSGTLAYLYGTTGIS